jgi:hypothetical protein
MLRTTEELEKRVPYGTHLQQSPYMTLKLRSYRSYRLRCKSPLSAFK